MNKKCEDEKMSSPAGDAPRLSPPASRCYPPLVMFLSLAQSCSEQDVKYIARGGRRRGRAVGKRRGVASACVGWIMSVPLHYSLMYAPCQAVIVSWVKNDSSNT